jgi:hypothetical protein
MINLFQPNDDLLGHQTPEPLARPAMTDTEHAIFTERFWYMGSIVPDGSIVFGAGLGYYPNRSIMDGYAGVTVEGVQYCFRASRHTGYNPLQTEIGALKITVLEGLHHHRIELRENASGVTMDIEYQASLAPNDEGRDVLRKGGQLIADVTRFVQFGFYTGWIAVNGRRWTFEGTQCWGARDRSWGLRVEARTDESHPPVTKFSPLLFAWVCAQFKTRGIHFFLKETAPGQPRSFVGNESGAIQSEGSLRAIRAVEHELKWFKDEFSQHIESGEFLLHFEDGAESRLKLRALPGRFYLKAGMYGGLDGWFQGDDKGAFHAEHSAWNHGDPATRRTLRTLAEQVMEFEYDGEIGYGTVQGGVSPGYPKYLEIQQQPMM